MEKEIKLGDEGRDRVSRYSGIVVCISQWLYGSRRVTLQAPVKPDGSLPASETFDEEGIEILNAGVFRPRPAE